MSQAAELLAGDSSVESAAHRVGLSSASALCHLVRRNTGLTPAQLGDRVREVPADPVQSAQTALPAQPTLHTWPRVNRFHVLLWAWRGRCSVTLGDTTIDLQEGELLRVPAGVPNHVAMEPGALVLPVGARVGRPAAVVAGQETQRPQSTVVTGESPDALLAAVGREYDPIAPEQTALVDRLFCTFLSGAEDTHGSRLLRWLTEEYRGVPPTPGHRPQPHRLGGPPRLHDRGPHRRPGPRRHRQCAPVGVDRTDDDGPASPGVRHPGRCGRPAPRVQRHGVLQPCLPSRTRGVTPRLARIRVRRGAQDHRSGDSRRAAEASAARKARTAGCPVCPSRTAVNSRRTGSPGSTCARVWSRNGPISRDGITATA